MTLRTRSSHSRQPLVFPLCSIASGIRNAPSDLEPRGSIDDEVGPHLNLFLTCARYKQPPVIVHIGTRLVYGTPRELPVNELHPVNPPCFYAAHKLLVEQT